MRIVETKVYEYDELNDKAKETARQWIRERLYGHSWWTPIYENAEQNALVEIDSFDLRGSIDISFLQGALNTCQTILKNHGESRDTYKAAQEYESAIDALPELPSEDSPDYDKKERELWEESEQIESEFIEKLKRCFIKMLRDESEYLKSDEYAEETIRINDYTFTEDGRRFG